MTKAKNNQAKYHFSYKNDDVDLVEIGQFIRDTTEFRVEREWYVAFDKWSGSFMGYSETIPNGFVNKPRNPDLMLIDKKTNKIKLILELDGEIHKIKFLDTQERNQDYFLAGIPLMIIDKDEIETDIFTLVHKKIGDYFGKED